MSYELKKINGIWHIGVEGAAEMCGVTDVTFRKWVGQPDPPPFDPRLTMCPLGELGDWIGRYRLFKTGRGGGYPYMPNLSKLTGMQLLPGLDPEPISDILDKQAEEARLTKLRADKLELDIAEQTARLIDADVVRNSWVRIVTLVKTRLLQIPSATAPLLAGETDTFEVQKRLDRSIREALESLSETRDQDDPEND